MAGVPMPESFIASRSSASSMSLPAVSIAASSEASVKRRGGWVSFRSDSTDAVSTVLALLELGQHWSPPESSSRRLGRGDLLAVDRFPARLHQPAAAGAEHVLGHGGLHARALEHGVGVEDREEALGDQVVDLQLVRAHLRQVVLGLVGMIAWWSSTFLSLTTRPSGSFSSEVTYSAPLRYCGVVADQLGGRPDVGDQSPVRKRELVRG